MTRTSFYIVSALVTLRNQVNVQYAQDDIKTETQPGVYDKEFTFVVEANFAHATLDTIVHAYISDLFLFSPKLKETQDSPTFEVKSLTYKKADCFFSSVRRW